ncbi:MAG: PEP-CTERM sorting domain-containing protein, partial [Verrucomicrobia bacterium]|nr:PEP-CTERM sorting domain-containing protein [Verrucomicrobiota bacterium]
GVLSSLNKAGAGLMVLAGSNSYTGSTTVSGGTLQVGNGGTTGNLGTANGVTLSNGATLAFNRTDSYGGNFTQAVSGAGGVALSAGTLTLQNTSNNFTGGVAVNGGTFRTLGNSAGNTIVVNNGGTFAMAGTDTWGSAGISSSPAVTLNSGGTMTSDGQFNTLRNLTLNGGSVNLNGGLASAGAFVLGGTVTAGGATTSTISASSGANNFIRLGREGVLGGVTEFNVTDTAGQLSVGVELANNFGASTAGLTKSGSGKMALSAVNTYTGATTVNAGLLKVLSGGSISSSSTTVNSGGTLDVGGTAGSVQVNSGGLLKGSGSVGAFTLASGGTLTPGNSPGTLTAASAIVLGGSTYNWEISALTGTAGTTWDLFSVGGLLDMSGVTSANKWNLVVTGDSGFAGWTDTSSYSYVFAQAASVSGFDSTVGTDVTSLFNITTSGIASKPNASFNANGDFKVVVGSANGVTTLNLMAVPEPSSGGLLLLGLGVVAWLRRRYQRAALGRGESAL